MPPTRTRWWSRWALVSGLLLGGLPLVVACLWILVTGRFPEHLEPKIFAAPGLWLLESQLGFRVPTNQANWETPWVLVRWCVHAVVNAALWCTVTFGLWLGLRRLIRGLRPGLTVAAVLIGLIPALDIAHNLVANQFPSTWWPITRVTAWSAFAVIEYLSRGSWVLTASTHTSLATYLERWTALVVVNVATWTGAFHLGGVLLQRASVPRDRLKEAGRSDQDGSSQARDGV